jgi:hypothetical protein
MTANARNYHLLGRAIGHFDPHRSRLTPGCLHDLLEVPQQAAVVLRHVWPEMLASPRCREALDRIDWDGFHPSLVDSMSFWQGLDAAVHRRA